MFCKLSISGTTFLKLPYDLFFMTKYCVDKLNLLTIHKVDSSYKCDKSVIVDCVNKYFIW
jgi:hypothetical protein